MPCLCWKQLFSMLCILCTYKRSYLDLDLMIYGNYVLIIIMLMSIHAYMYVFMPLFDRLVIDHDDFMLVFTCICMYLRHCLTGLPGIKLVEE